MTKIKIYLNNGLEFDATVTNYDAEEFTNAANNPQLTLVNIGGIVLSKHAVMMITPVGE